MEPEKSMSRVYSVSKFRWKKNWMIIFNNF